MMKKLTGLLLYSSFLLIGCDRQTKPVAADNKINGSAPKQEIAKLNDYLKKFEEPSQNFNVSASKPSQVKGKKGTIISVNPSDLETVDGQPIGTSIQVELKELMNQEQLLRTNAQTVSNGQLLVSGGAYFIDMTSNGQKLKLKNGKTLKVVFPKLTDNEMALFYGQRDSLGQMNWQKANQAFVYKKQPDDTPVTVKKRVGAKTDIEQVIDYLDSSDQSQTDEQRAENVRRQKMNVRNPTLSEKVYDAINLESLGWINCDRFLKINDKTEFIVQLNPADSITNANIILVFKDINCVLQGYYKNVSGEDNSVSFEDIPVGYETRLIAFTVKNDKVYAFASDVKIGKNQQLEIDLKPIKEEAFKNLMSKG